MIIGIIYDLSYSFSWLINTCPFCVDFFTVLDLEPGGIYDTCIIEISVRISVEHLEAFSVWSIALIWEVEWRRSLVSPVVLFGPIL